MKLESIRKNAANYLEGIQRIEGTGVDLSAKAVQDAERIVYLCDEVFSKVTEDERQRIKSIPAWSTDYSAVKDIKEKYGLSWSELKMLRDE